MGNQFEDLSRKLVSSGFEKVYPRSLVESGETTYFLARDGAGKKVLCIHGESPAALAEAGFSGVPTDTVFACPLSPENARALRARLTWLSPVQLGLTTSAGTGDRLGLATPGHIRAIRRSAGIAPVLAQQSMRENARTGRSPQEVMDDALWGVVEEGWRDPWGADADHLKTTADVDLCVAAGYTFFTLDPGDHVDNAAHTDALERLQEKFAALPWPQLEDDADAMTARYIGQQMRVNESVVTFNEVSLLRAACKYGRALAHAAAMYRHLAEATGGTGFDLEISVDETETPTTPLEHIFIASELLRLGVDWVSLAPRYVGRFEKGVDYIGDLTVFEIEFAMHAQIARQFGPYKLSIHSGSDKFSIYPIMAQHTQRVAHLKTAGTSYLEALRAIAVVDPALFREILTLAIDRYPTDRATYHVSADVTRVPAPSSLADMELARVLDAFDAREVLHVTFGSVLDAYGDRLKALLDANEEAHYAVLETHFMRHLTPFSSA
jgi:tagaturonate epimerase